MKKFSLPFLFLILHFILTPPINSQEILSESKRKEKLDQLYQTYQAKHRHTPYLSVEDILELREDELAIIYVDVRSRKERKVSKIPGALSEKKFHKRRKEFVHHTIVVYCTAGLRSFRYTNYLLKKGMKAYNLKGGILAWTHAHQPLIGKKGPTTRVHIYNEEFNLLADGYEAVW